MEAKTGLTFCEDHCRCPLENKGYIDRMVVLGQPLSHTCGSPGDGIALMVTWVSVSKENDRSG